MTKLKGLLLTEGMHGMISQVEGLAKALDLDFIHEKIELNNFWKLIPPKITPSKSFVFKNNIEHEFNIVISCGRKSVIPSIYLKKKFKEKIVNIHIQDPKVSLTKGAIHYLRENELDENISYLKPKIKKEKIVTLVVGGPNKYYDYKLSLVEEIFSKIKQNFINNDYQLIFIPSMRTPKNVIDQAKNYFDNDQIIITEIDKKAYLSSLRLADHIVVTCDSTSMISEAAITGKPIYVAQMPHIKNNYRFKKFFEMFRKLNITKDLSDNLEVWKYEKLNETDRISGYIKSKLKDYDIS